MKKILKTKFMMAVSMSLCLAVSLIGWTMSGSTSVFAQNSNKSTKSSKDKDKNKKKKEEVIELNAMKIESRGEEADKNIKNDSSLNEMNNKMDAPAEKMGASRGSSAAHPYYCEVHTDNYTSYYIKIYVDGSYRGTVPPYGNILYYAYPGATEVYAKADFTNGSSLSWGPRNYSCDENEYITFKMYSR